eukprot:m.49207 g.49207  ORF g.49207 m.49207 type:complete len:361 (+) comp15305_c0_seq2:282-1364(+)
MTDNTSKPLEVPSTDALGNDKEGVSSAVGDDSTISPKQPGARHSQSFHGVVCDYCGSPNPDSCPCNDFLGGDADDLADAEFEMLMLEEAMAAMGDNYDDFSDQAFSLAPTQSESSTRKCRYGAACQKRNTGCAFDHSGDPASAASIPHTETKQEPFTLKATTDAFVPQGFLNPTPTDGAGYYSDFSDMHFDNGSDFDAYYSPQTYEGQYQDQYYGMQQYGAHSDAEWSTNPQMTFVPTATIPGTAPSTAAQPPAQAAETATTTSTATAPKPAKSKFIVTLAGSTPTPTPTVGDGGAAASTSAASAASSAGSKRSSYVIHRAGATPSVATATAAEQPRPRRPKCHSGKSCKKQPNCKYDHS